MVRSSGFDEVAGGSTWRGSLEQFDSGSSRCMDGWLFGFAFEREIMGGALLIHDVAAVQRVQMFGDGDVAEAWVIMGS